MSVVRFGTNNIFDVSIVEIKTYRFVDVRYIGVFLKFNLKKKIWVTYVFEKSRKKKFTFPSAPITCTFCNLRIWLHSFNCVKSTVALIFVVDFCPSSVDNKMSTLPSKLYLYVVPSTYLKVFGLLPWHPVLHLPKKKKILINFNKTIIKIYCLPPYHFFLNSFNICLTL